MNVSPCTMLRDWLVANFQVEGVGANEAPGAAGRASDVRNLWAQQFDEQMANYDDPEAAEELKNALLRGLGSQETRPLAAVITSLVNAPPSGAIVSPSPPLSVAFQSPLKTKEIQYFSSTSSKSSMPSTTSNSSL